VLPVLLSLAAAFLFAAGTVIQQQVAAAASDKEALGAGFLLQLARKPRWLAGIVIDGLGFVCQAIALGIGRLVVVQPLLATTVVFALPLGAKLTHQRVGRREVVAAIAVAGGVGAFLVIADPSGGIDNPTTTGWIVTGVVSGAACAALVGAGIAADRPGVKATFFGTATGILFAVSAALTKAVVEQLEDGVLTLFTHWQLYALIVIGYASMTLSQTSLQTGVLAPAIATQMAIDPVASLLIGTLAFDETIQETDSVLLVSLVALGAMLAGLVVLAASQQHAEEDQAPEAGGEPPGDSAASSAKRV
jgi:drug/metabolite transporter (DMT)-like permease